MTFITTPSDSPCTLRIVSSPPPSSVRYHCFSPRPLSKPCTSAPDIPSRPRPQPPLIGITLTSSLLEFWGSRGLEQVKRMSLSWKIKLHLWGSQATQPLLACFRYSWVFILSGCILHLYATIAAASLSKFVVVPSLMNLRTPAKINKHLWAWPRTL